MTRPLLLVLALSVCGAAQAPWKTIPAEQAGLDRAKLEAMRDSLQALHTSSLLVVRRGALPFTIAIHEAPAVFDPGSQYAYSNPGMAALAYAVTASLKETRWKDIRTLLKERVMDRIGVPETDWSIGYGQAYEVDGMKLYAN